MSGSQEDIEGALHPTPVELRTKVVRAPLLRGKRLAPITARSATLSSFAPKRICLCSGHEWGLARP